MMSRPAAAVAQAKWASGACITPFGHYDPALACRMTGCLLEYYDDVELDGLSVLQFYGKCDEIIAAIRCLQFRAVSEAYRVEKMDVAAAVFREYLNSTWRSWPRPPPVDGGAQAAHGNREFVQFVGSRDFYTKRDVVLTDSDPRICFLLKRIKNQKFAWPLTEKIKQTVTEKIPKKFDQFKRI